MSISASSTVGFNPSPSQSFSLANTSSSSPSSDALDSSSSVFKKIFAVSSLKSLNRRQHYVLVLDFDRHLLAFHKVRRGKEVKRSFPFQAAVKLERDAKNSAALSTIFGHEPRYKKHIIFASMEERELFCNLVHAMIVSGSKAVKLFKVRQHSSTQRSDFRDQSSICFRLVISFCFQILVHFSFSRFVSKLIWKIQY